MNLNIKAINLPLLVLFGLCYALGHPALASIRPVLVDKTLASFHDDVNRTVTGSALQAARLFEPQAAASVTPAMRAEPLAFAVANADPTSWMAKHSRKLAELPRHKGGGFTVLSVQ